MSPSQKSLVFSCYYSVMLCKYCQVKTLFLVRFGQVMLIFVFGKLTITVNDLCELIGDICIGPICLAVKQAAGLPSILLSEMPHLHHILQLHLCCLFCFAYIVLYC